MCNHAGVVSEQECPYCHPSQHEPITDTKRIDWLQANYPTLFGGYYYASKSKPLREAIDERMRRPSMRGLC